MTNVFYMSMIKRMALECVQTNYKLQMYYGVIDKRPELIASIEIVSKVSDRFE